VQGGRTDLAQQARSFTRKVEVMLAGLPAKVTLPLPRIAHGLAAWCCFASPFPCAS
jgi:hypothetical protein